MEAAINRGQSKSSSGATLSNVVLETMAPAQVGMIIEAETDNSKRTLDELKHIVKKAGGLSTSASHLFEKKGRITFEEHEKLGVDDVLDEAIEAGALDVTQDEGIVVWTEPNNTMAAAETLTEKLGLKVQTAEIVWDANEETKSPLDTAKHQEAIVALKHFIDQLRDHGDVSAIYANVAQGNLSDDEWEEVQERLDS
jgi:transcriptional/translational regulatory protein YebC/TACO1